MTAPLLRFVFCVVLVALMNSTDAQSQSIPDLRAALSSAKKQTDGLDAAYELVGIADSAQQQHEPDIVKEATGALIQVLERAAAAAMKAPVADAHDTLDQLVDLSFFARTSNVTGADEVLQQSLRALLPKLTRDVRSELQSADISAERWPVALTNFSTLGELQAAAVLTMQIDIAQDIAADFENEFTRLKAMTQKAPETSRAAMTEDIEAAKKNRDEQIADATANDLAAVVAEMTRGDQKASGRDTDMDSGGETDVDLTCTETGAIGQESGGNFDHSKITKLEEECVLSGRVPTDDRCSAPNRLYACRQTVSDSMEQLIYVYRGTPEERKFKDTCKGDILTAAQLTGPAPAFKNKAMHRIMTCTPVSGGMN